VIPVLVLSQFDRMTGYRNKASAGAGGNHFGSFHLTTIKGFNFFAAFESPFCFARLALGGSSRQTGLLRWAAES
jgi:hypothetical protein